VKYNDVYSRKEYKKLGERKREQGALTQPYIQDLTGPGFFCQPDLNERALGT
jgi:hypothetical protein